MRLSGGIGAAAARVRAELCKLDGFSLLELAIVIIFATIAVPGIVGLYTTILTNSHDAEFMSVADMLAIEQMEIILADKAGSGCGYGYGSITSQRYAGVNPGPPFDAYSRTVNIQVVNPGQTYEYKLITVTVSTPAIPPVVLTAFVMNHEAL